MTWSWVIHTTRESWHLKELSNLERNCSQERGSDLWRLQGHLTAQQDFVLLPVFLLEPVKYNSKPGLPADTPITMPLPLNYASHLGYSIALCKATFLPACGYLGAGALVGLGVCVPGVDGPGMRRERGELGCLLRMPEQKWCPDTSPALFIPCCLSSQVSGRMLRMQKSVRNSTAVKNATIHWAQLSITRASGYRDQKKSF